MKVVDRTSDVMKYIPDKIVDKLAEQNGRKFNDGKIDYTLLPPNALAYIVRVLEHGAEKYDRDNWRGLESGKERYLKAFFRHVIGMLGGGLNAFSVVDEDSGLPHWAHAGACMFFVVYFMDQEAKKDE